MDIEKFTETARKQAKAQSTGYCARFIRQALEAAGGVVNPRPVSAKDYGTVLTDNDFNIVNEFINDGYKPRNGDVVVWYENKSTIHGHIQVFVAGCGWVSDFKQSTIFPNSKHRELWLSGGYTIYRYNY